MILTSRPRCFPVHPKQILTHLTDPRSRVSHSTHSGSDPTIYQPETPTVVLSQRKIYSMTHLVFFLGAGSSAATIA